MIVLRDLSIGPDRRSPAWPRHCHVCEPDSSVVARTLMIKLITSGESGARTLGAGPARATG
ncbi:hypothetical protein SDC9_126240 [bioreactor metagenome]|uniref:Uncharacterized protein n=1 Tax=bioreactor metagenome TaxID=1076179 RepID=A0A645CQM2_9ZZZZ